MRALLDFLKDLLQAVTSPGAPWPDQSCCQFRRRHH